MDKFGTEAARQQSFLAVHEKPLGPVARTPVRELDLSSILIFSVKVETEVLVISEPCHACEVEPELNFGIFLAKGHEQLVLEDGEERGLLSEFLRFQLVS